MNDFITYQVIVLILGGVANYEKKVAATFNVGTGEITFTPPMSAQIVAGTPFRLINIPSPEDIAYILANVTDLLADVGPASGSTLGSLYAILGNPATNIATLIGAISGWLLATSAGVKQEKATTIDIGQIAGTYDLFTGATQALVVEGLVFRCSGGAGGGNLTSISIQTNDATPQVLIDAVSGRVTNLTNEAQLSWAGKCYLKVGQKIQITLAGGAATAAKVCDVVADYRAVVDGGTL